MLLLAMAGQASALSTYYPIQTIGNRGSDVRALQYLLRAAGQSVTVDGHFGTSTQTAVKRHQQAKGLPVTGLVNDPTWRSLTPNLSTGSPFAPWCRLTAVCVDVPKWPSTVTD